MRSLITFEERDHAESYVADMDASGRNAILIANKGEAQALDADGGAIGPGVLPSTSGKAEEASRIRLSAMSPFFYI